MLKIVGIVLAVLIVILLLVGIYFYNFHVFKTVRVCIGDANNIMLPCGSDQDCIGLLEGRATSADLGSAPVFVQEKFQEIMNGAAYCDRTCFIRDVRGINLETQEFEDIESCDPAETEIVAEIRGKEGLELWSWMKDRQA